MAESIPVTQPFLPPEREYLQWLNNIWQQKRLTNDGPLLKLLEEKLGELSGLPRPVVTANGTLAIQLALRALSVNGREVITTPLSYVATTSALVYEGCTPVFADVDASTMNIDPGAVERLINKNTRAILATHVYGIPCQVERLEEIAEKHNLQLIFDAAHAFNTEVDGKSILAWGHLSTCSFHATKLFHTVEGGAIYLPKTDAQLVHRLKMLRNFGHNGFYQYDGVGINAKNSELHAAMGLAILPFLDEIITRRRHICNLYDRLLGASSLIRPQISQPDGYNHAYYPVIFPSEKSLLKTMGFLFDRGIATRRYFYPMLNRLDYVKTTHAPVAENLAPRVLCLPLFHELKDEQVNRIAKQVLKCL